MPAERAGYTVTMFLVDVSSSMANTRSVDLPLNTDNELHNAEMTHLEWALQFVKIKIQEMIFAGRKTEQCGVILFGSEETNNIVHTKNGGYDNVLEYIPIAQPNSATLAKLDALQPSTTTGDPIDALIVGIETQATYLAKKRTWTRKIVLVTDGETPMEVEDWEAVSKKMNALDISLTIVGVDFDDLEFPYQEEDKSNIKRANEEFYQMFTSSLNNGIVGTCAYALQEVMRPDVHNVKSALLGTVLRVGDVDTRPEESIEISIKMTKCTAISRPKSWKKYHLRVADTNMQTHDNENEGKTTEFAQLRVRTEYYVNRQGEAVESESVKEEDDEENLLDAMDSDEKEQVKDKNVLEKVEKEELVRGFKYGTTYAPCPDGQFPKLPTRKGMDICGFFPAKKFRRELAMGEVQYVWADPSSSYQQAALSSIVQATQEKGSMAIARLVTRDGMDPKMGVLLPTRFEKVDCFLWIQMPFADDVRKYSFASLEHLVSKNGEVLTTHPYLPTREQQEAMDAFVDGMDLMEAGGIDEEGNRQPWFDTRLSYNPALHRVKQALLHCAVVSDLNKNPLPPPHPELLKYFNTPPRIVKRAMNAAGHCKEVFGIKQVPKKVAKAKQDDHQHAEEDDEEQPLLLDLDHFPKRNQSQVVSTRPEVQVTPPSKRKGKAKAMNDSDSDTEEDEDEFVHVHPGEAMEVDRKPVSATQRAAHLPTPARSVSPTKRVHKDDKMTVDEDDDIDPGREAGRIIGTTNPLRDFRKNLERGDMVTKAVEDMGYVIGQVVLRPFASRRKDEMLESLKEMRNVALKEDEIDAWNAFMRDFKKKCLGTPGNRTFWAEVKSAGRQLSLISEMEADEYGGTSTVTEKEAKTVSIVPGIHLSHGQ
ncbi:hypothetical protein AMATHDRAFT_144450 [Amanita thiersii Skay4041]|uniref:ATP-dependent DNA helicase II subunit 2 n=1 Tax=Amanita thiersii Skay4041 TaxID=703135 RepID=A0A2A9NST8_9AGAR|nr:hypothetical protein AMATHDRAFT_144450 [Amanita thiersii Skay4041]